MEGAAVGASRRLAPTEWAPATINYLTDPDELREGLTSRGDRGDLVPYAPGYHARLAELARTHV